MTRKQIDASRERRLWISQVIMPTVTIVGSLIAIPEVRQGIAATAKEIKVKISKAKIKKNLKKESE